MNPIGTARSAGFALVAVLVMLALLSLIALSMLSSGSVAYQLAHYTSARARAGALAEAGANRAILGLLDPEVARRWRVDGTAYKLALFGGNVSVTIEDELGKIDLNAADGPTLTALFASVGLDPIAAEALVDKILDWRDPAGAKRLNGAKDADYRAAGYDYGPRNGPFQRIDELMLVMGMNADLYRKVAPALTVYSGRPRVDPQTAPKEVLLALQGMDVSGIDALLAARSGGGASGAASSGSTLPPGIIDPAQSLAGRAFTIRAEARDPEGLSLHLDAVIRATDDPRQPYWVLAWEEK